MSYFYFFKHDGQCKWMQNELAEEIPRYLYEPVEYQGEKTKFYLILKWIKNGVRGINFKALDEFGVNYVATLDQLPKGAGIYVTGYDADIEELAAAKARRVPVIERPCPWVRKLRTQMLASNPDSHQVVVMIDKDHMVYDCYKSIFPKDAIVVTPENYQTEIITYKNEKPVAFMVYATFRKKDAELVAEYINRRFGHPDNILDGYHKTLCTWTRQGLLEEIGAETKARSLGEIWVICSSEGDRSTISILNEIREAGAHARIIKDDGDIPEKVVGDSRIGVLLAPIPLARKIRAIKKSIEERFNANHQGGTEFE